MNEVGDSSKNATLDGVEPACKGKLQGQDALDDQPVDSVSPGGDLSLAVLAGPPDDRDSDEPHGLAAIEAELIEDSEPEVAEEEPVVGTSCAVSLPETLMRIVDARINIWRRLDEMDRRRTAIREQAGNREVADEVARQSRELKKIPARAVLEASGVKLRERRAKLPASTEAADPASKGKNAPPPPSPFLAGLLDLGIEQANLLVKRSKLDVAVVPAALPTAEAEPLLKLCRAQGIQGEALMGWTCYAMGLLQRISHYRSIEEDYNLKLAQARDEQKSRGLMRVLANRDPGLPPLDSSVGCILRAARLELQAVEPQLTELFWGLYEELAWLLCRPEGHEGKPRPDAEDITTIRAFLRYGLVSAHPALLKRETAEYIHADCRDDVHVWSNEPAATHVVHADEYIEGIATRKLTVSPDEDLELNHRNSPTWRADRVWRQAVIGQIRRELIETKLKELGDELARLQVIVQDKEEKYRLLRADGKKTEANAVSHELIGVKARSSRVAKAVDQIEHIVLPKLRDQAVEAGARLTEEERVLTLEAVVRREARFVRRAARLAARLKEPFPPFVLRDSFEPLRGDHHHRKAVLDEIHKIEQADRFIFHQVLLPNQKLDRRVTVRMSPTLLLPPCRGQMSFSFCERRWDDNGRLVLPLISLRQGSLPDLLVNTLADFRWDCSKEEAGMDWITADALCAGYAAVRWAVRKMPEKTQKMMGIDPKLKDKPNWRGHYRLFIMSAKDAGRLLFNKCDDLYKIVVKYIGLPPGVEVLKRD